jgi:RHS repeat-associated protein
MMLDVTRMTCSEVCVLDYKFTGKERDTESGLDYFGARYYSSNMGRFSSPDDPFISGSPGDPQSWNLYSYVQNNPLNSTDPDGGECGDGEIWPQLRNGVAREPAPAQAPAGRYTNGIIGRLQLRKQPVDVRPCVERSGSQFPLPSDPRTRDPHRSGR